MRITNKIMQNNSLSNINTNKILQDKLNNQMSTQKKINRPSDDPVVAIRALRLRSNVTEITQYYEKNIPDAESWLSVTEGAIQNLTEVITDMYEQCTKGSNGDLKPSDREIILESLEALRDEVYCTGDSDYAGRYVFTGYRTNTSLSFATAEQMQYTITEQLTNEAVDSITYVKTGKTINGENVDITDINEHNYEDVAISETEIDSTEIYRIRLAYSDCEAGFAPVFTWTDTQEVGGVTTALQKPFTYDDGTGTMVAATTTTIHLYDNPYEQVTDNSIIYIPETGEMLLGKNIYDQVMSKKDNPTTASVNEGEIRITYQKTNWVKGDLRPEHYFASSNVDKDGVVTQFNQDYLDFGGEKQVIEYDVGFNQAIRVNTTADECFTHGIKREVDDLVSAMEDVVAAYETVTKLEGMLKNASETEKETIQLRLNAANKAYDLLKDKEQKMFEKSITSMQGYLDMANLALTNVGTRSKKLELIENRLMSQQTTFKTLKSENEDAEMTEVAINLTSAEMTYEAALMATGKVMKNTLLDFI